MSRLIFRTFLAAAAAGATLATLGFTGASAAVPGAPPSLAGPVASAAAGDQLWVARYSGGGAASVAASPDGSKVFVTGSIDSPVTGGPQFATVAYSTATGAQLWAKRYAGTESAVARTVAVSPDGRKVFVAGNSPQNDGAAYIVFAYDAATGAKLWAASYPGFRPYIYGFRASAMAVSPDGTEVVVTGTGFGEAPPAPDYVTAAFRASTGARLWAKVYNGPANSRDYASSVAVSASGRVFVTGTSYGGASRRNDYATVAYAGATGTQVWARSYNGPASRDDRANSIAVSPDRTWVFVTGIGDSGNPTASDYATIAYRAATGARRWVKLYNGPGSGRDEARSVTVSASGRVFVTGSVYGGASRLSDYATVAYAGATGTQVWARSYNGPASRDDRANSIAVSPDRTWVFVTGGSDGGTATASDYATIAYRAATGERLWVTRYDGPSTDEGPSDDGASAITASPSGSMVFVTGISGDDYATVAYRN